MNRQAGVAHREELQLWKPNNLQNTKEHTLQQYTTHIFTKITSAPFSNMNKLTNSAGSVESGI